MVNGEGAEKVDRFARGWIRAAMNGLLNLGAKFAVNSQHDEEKTVLPSIIYR